MAMGNEGKKPERGLGRGGDRLDHFSLVETAMITLIGNDNLPERGLGWRRDCLDGLGNGDNRGLLHLLLSHVHHVGDCSRSLTTEYFTFNFILSYLPARSGPSIELVLPQQRGEQQQEQQRQLR